MHSANIYMPRAPHNFTLKYIHPRLSSFAYSQTRSPFCPTSPLSQPLVLYHLRITAGLSQTCHNSPAAVPTLSQAPPLCICWGLYAVLGISVPEGGGEFHFIYGLFLYYKSFYHLFFILCPNIYSYSLPILEQ